MARILGIDYGTKRTGLATTDPLQIIATALETVPTEAVKSWLENYVRTETVERFVLGEPLHEDGNPAQIHDRVLEFRDWLEKTFPDLPVVLQDERYSSVRARSVILQSGAKRKKRRDKSLVDKVSAVLILEDYMRENVW